MLNNCKSSAKGHAPYPHRFLGYQTTTKVYYQAAPISSISALLDYQHEHAGSASHIDMCRFISRFMFFNIHGKLFAVRATKYRYQKHTTKITKSELTLSFILRLGQTCHSQSRILRFNFYGRRRKTPATTHGCTLRPNWARFDLHFDSTSNRISVFCILGKFEEVQLSLKELEGNGAIYSFCGD